MLSPRILTTLFCQNLLHTHEPPLFTHLTLHIPLKTIAGYYRSTFDNHYTTMSFCLGPQRCVGFYVDELDSEVEDGPRLFVWKTLGEYLAHNEEPLPESEAWGTLLKLFATVDVFTDKAKHTRSGMALAASPPFMELYRNFD